MTSQAGVAFPHGATSHPNEHRLQLHARVLHEIPRAREFLGDTPNCAVFDDFVIQPVFVRGFDFPF